MPVFEYYCRANHTVYAFFAKVSVPETAPPMCPDDPDLKLVRFSPPEPAPTSPPKTVVVSDREYTELVQQLTQHDLRTVEPKQIGRLLRRLIQLVRMPLPPSLEDAVDRLEDGEPSEVIELSLPAAVEQEELFEGDTKGHSSGLVRRILRYLPPRKDPNLYDYEDFLPRSSN